MMAKDSNGKAISRLKGLPEATLSIVDTRLTSGESANSVAAWLQEDCQLFTDVKQTSVRKMLERYRKGPLRNKVLDRITGAHAHMPIASVQKRLNALDEVEEMVRIQRGRVDKMLALEVGKPILLKTTTDEIHLLKDMLMDLGRIQLETGVLARATKKISGSIIGADGQQRQFEWTEAQEKLVKELEAYVGDKAEV